MTTFLQFHVLMGYGPSNPNRDDLGKPKQAKIGGYNRLRISSQSLKRALRESSFFAFSMKDNLGTRTKKIRDALKDRGITNGVDAVLADTAAESIAAVFGKIGDDGKATTLAFISPEEWKNAELAFDRLVAGENIPNADLKKMILCRADGAVDIAMFGRMLADDADYNRDAAVQVSHAFTTHVAQAEDDFFTAVDDLNKREETGAGHMGDHEFGSGIFYTYICVNCDLLIENLGGDKELAAKAVEALASALPQTTPGGKQNSFAHHPRAHYVLVESGKAAPHNLDAAFYEPVREQPLLTKSIVSLKRTRDLFERAYGKRNTRECEMDVFGGTGSVAEIVRFVGEEMRGI